MELKTFQEFDELDFEPFSNQLISFIETDRHFVEGALILSLNGGFGSGKSTFFEMLYNKLKAEDSLFDPIILNAWESDFQEDALLAIIYELVGYLEKQGISTNTDTLKNTAGKLGKMALSIGNDVVSKFTGVDLKKAGDGAEERKPHLLGKACFDLYKDRHEAFSTLKELIRKMVSESEKPIVIMLDELDRCRPDYAVEYLETIKHIFDIEGLIFVLGVDKKALESSVKCLYGETLNFDEYYRKFAHRNISLPNPDELTFKGFTRGLYQRYIIDQIDEKRYCCGGDHRDKVDQMSELIEAFPVTPRQLHEILRLIAHALLTTEDKQTQIPWGRHLGTIVMATLSVSNSSIYHKIGKKNIKPREMSELLLGKMSLSEGSEIWWQILIFYGIFNLEELTILEFIEELKYLGLYSDDWTEESVDKQVRGMGSAYSYRRSIRVSAESPYVQIYRTLESCKRFAE